MVAEDASKQMSGRKHIGPPCSKCGETLYYSRNYTCVQCSYLHNVRSQERQLRKRLAARALRWGEWW